MGACFKLEIFTPQKMFFSGEIEKLIFNATDGQMGILKGHHPMTASVSPGEFKICLTDGTWKSAFISEGFIEVRPDEVLMFSHSCEWPEDIDEAKAKAALERETEQLRNAESLSEHRSAEIALQRITAMLSVKKTHTVN